MGFWEAVGGAVLGGLVGGPVGAAVGAGIGSSLGTDENAPTAPGWPTIPMELGWEDDQDGRALLIKPEIPLPGVAGFRVDLMDVAAERFVRGRAPYCDDDGDFYLFATPDPADGYGRCYAPIGAARVASGASLMLRVIALTNDSVVGVSMFEMGWPAGRYSRSRLLRPIIGLAMRVAKADGKLDRSEVSYIRKTLVEEFELEAGDQDSLRELMKSEPSASVAEQVRQIWRRMPEIPSGAIIQLLASVAHADGVIHPGEVDVIRNAALALGLDADGWPEVAADLGLLSNQDRLADAYAAFGLSPDATLADARSAYLAKMRDYHPDKVAHLPPEFQEVAHKKSQELNEAYEALKEALS